MNEFKQVASIADRLREAMATRSIKQIDLVRMTGIAASAINRYLSGEYEPKNKKIYEMARALDVSEQWLMGYDAPMERPQAQKKNDALTDIVVELRTNKDFLSIVETIYGLDAEKRAGVKQMLDALLK